MSHDATNWAIKQRGIKPAAKVVLWHLCDRYHPDNGCFPSLDTLAEDCEMSRRSVQDQIDALVEAGLIRVEKMPRDAGKLPRNRYRFSFETSADHLGQNLPRAKSALGKNARSPLANSRDHLGQNLPTNLVREPLREPVMRAGARDGGGGIDDPREKEGSGASDDSFDRFWSAFPDPVEREDSRKAFEAVLESGEVGPDDLIEAARVYAGSRHVERGFGMKPGNWLRRGSWREQWEEGRAARDAVLVAAPDPDKEADIWIAPIKAGKNYVGNCIKIPAAQNLLKRGLVTSDELRRVGVNV